MSTFENDGGADDGIIGSTAVHDKNGISGRNDDPTARNAAIPEGNGVFGTTQVPDGAGIFGLHNTGGVGVAGFGHPTGIGVVGMSVPANAKGGDGVLGVSNSELRNGIIGRNDSTTAKGPTAPQGGNGVFGFTQVPDGAGVFGAHATTGAGVAGLGLIGVSGGSVDGVGVLGISAPPGAKGGDGVQGITNSELRNGVYGRNDSITKRGTSDPAGNGVFGFSQVPDGSGVLGAHGAGGHGVIGTGGFGVVGTGDVIGVWGQAKDGNGIAGYFSGPVHVDGGAVLTGDLQVGGNVKTSGNFEGPVTFDGNLNVTGDLNVAGDVVLTNRDLAEQFAIAETCESVPGAVMVIDDEGKLAPCRDAYDKRAIGVVSGAGNLRPAIKLGAGALVSKAAPIAMIGTAYCLVDAGYGPIEIGDLLTSSETFGHAMKAGEPGRSFGAVIGKALAALPRGRGLIPMVVALQ